jgi:hypothetical protein
MRVAADVLGPVDAPYQYARDEDALGLSLRHGFIEMGLRPSTVSRVMRDGGHLQLFTSHSEKWFRSANPHLLTIGISRAALATGFDTASDVELPIAVWTADPPRWGAAPKAAGARLSEFRSGRMVHDKDSAIGECLHRVASVARNDRNDARSHDVREPVHLHLELTGNDLVHFLLGMEVLVDRRSRCELVVGESHSRRVEEAAFPAWQALDDLEAGRIQKRHETSLAHQAPTCSRQEYFHWLSHLEER